MIGLNPKRYLNNPEEIQKAAKRMMLLTEPKDELKDPLGWRHFEYKNLAKNSNKFWEISEVITAYNSNETDPHFIVHLRWGRIGTRGQEQVKKFQIKKDAEEYRSNKILEKVKEGYYAAIL